MPLWKLIRPGDLLFYRVTPRSAWLSKLIGLVQKLRNEGSHPQTYSHVSLVDIEQGFQLEAKWPRTRRSLIDWRASGLELYRIQDATPEQIGKMLVWAHDHLGDWYDLGQALFGWFNTPHAEICTTYVMKSVQAGGLNLDNGFGKFKAPNELVESPLLVRIY